MMFGLRMGSSSSFNQETKHGFMDDDDDDRLEADAGFDSIPSSSEVSSDAGSSEADLTDEAASSAAASPPPSSPSSSSFSASSSSGLLATSPLLDMSSLIHQLPLKRGLSSYFQGKSQSFTSLANVSCLEDLVKPENPYNKKLKTCRSYGGLSGSQRSSSSSSSRSHLPKSTSSSSRFFPKRASSSPSSRVSCSSLVGANGSPNFLGKMVPTPPPPPHRSSSTSSISNRTPLLA